MSKTSSHWFYHNGFKTNSEKFNFLLNPFADRPIKLMWSIIKARKKEILLVVKIDNDLTLKEHLTSICTKVYQKLHVLTRIFKYMSLQKCQILKKLFITSQFN